MLTVATLFWQSNHRSQSFSSMYDEEWVEKLYRGFNRNLSHPFRFVCYSDKKRSYVHPEIEEARIKSLVPSYADCIQPYEIDGPLMLVGLDTVITGNLDELAEHCHTSDKLALPIDPYFPYQACNGVALVPQGHTLIAAKHKGQNDMEWVRKFPHDLIDKLFPGQVLSWKAHVEKRGLGDGRIIYFHGDRKPHQFPRDPIIREHWL